MSDLPWSLLYEVAKYLDVHSQRSLFMVNAHLYSKWHLQALATPWHCLSLFIDVLSEVVADGKCNTEESFVEAFYDQDQNNESRAHVRIATDSGFILKLVFHNDGKAPCVQSCRQYEDKQSLMKAFLGRSDAPFVWARLCSGWCSEPVRIKSLAAYCFSLLQRFQGVLRLMAESSTPVLEFSSTTWIKDLCRSSAIRHHNEKWTIDGKQCKVANPKLNFSCIPEEFKKANAHSLTQTKPDSGTPGGQPDLIHYQPSNEAKVKFAYRVKILL